MSGDLPEVGPWAREKLEGLEDYLSAYMTILSKHAPLKTVYVDAFAAGGRAVVRQQDHDDPTIHLDLGDEAREGDAREVIDGSPQVALDINPPFNQYVFIEMDERRLADLRKLEVAYKGRRNIAVRAGDCNEYLTTRLLKTLAANGLWRGVVFLDPFGMHVPWSTIEQLAKTAHVEVFLNFPVGMAIQRLLPRSGRFTEKRRAKLDDYFGDPGWYEQVYALEPGFFGDQLRKHDDAAKRLVRWYRERLKTAFGFVSKERLITNSKGGHLYYLIFAGPNATGAKIASHVLSAGARGRDRASKHGR
jgi:three-Cys-motif partner protein